MKGGIAGFRFNSKKKIARFEVILPGTGARKRVRKQVEAKSRDEALDLWKQFREDVLSGQEKKPPATFKEFCDEYWLKIASHKTASTARDQYSVIKKHLLPEFGEMRLDRINAAAVKDFSAALLAKGYSPVTIGGYIAILTGLLHQAVEREVIPAYPIRGRLPRLKKTLPKLEMSPEELSRFLAAFDDEKGFNELLGRERSKHAIAPNTPAASLYFARFRASRPLFVVALETGLRRGDLLGLKWSSVDLKAGVVSVKTGKTGQEVVIPMSQACRAALEDCRKQKVVGAFVFLTHDHQPFAEVTLRRYFAWAKELAGINRRLRFHDLRHTFGSTLASAGVSIQVIAKALGHSSVKMSERYARPSSESLKVIASALDRRFSNSSLNSGGKGGQG